MPKLTVLVTYIENKDEGLNTSVAQHFPDEAIKWRLTNPSDGSDEMEEVVLKIQGVLCEKDLPPVRFGTRLVRTYNYDSTDQLTTEGWRTKLNTLNNLSH